MNNDLVVDYEEVKHCALIHIADMLEWVWIETVNSTHQPEKPYEQEWSDWNYKDDVEEKEIIHNRLLNIANKKGHSEFIEPIEMFISQIGTGSLGIDEFVHDYLHAVKTILLMANEEARIVARKNDFCKIAISNSGITITLSINVGSDGFVGLIRYLQNHGLRPTAVEHIAIYFATHCFQEEKNVNHTPGWQLPGTGAHQTIMSVTDPGLGHIYGTCLDQKNLDGIIIHVEHLERGVRIPRKSVEPYRIPDPQILKRIMFMSGGYIPVSTYVGRPIFEGGFSESLLKTVRTLASACSFFFSLGVAECKVAVENMTAQESIIFLRMMNKSTVKKSHSQIISAAFCINEPIMNDNDGHNEWITDPLAIGLLAINIVTQSGLRKVTWDGTADHYPSKCIVEQLGFKSAARLVHEAHQVGLLTYFSAGFRFDNIEDAVYSGVDGIGIGGAQILRYMDSNNGNHGPFIARNIQKILALRNIAEHHIAGKSAQKLAYLDTLFSKGQCIHDCDEFRNLLFEKVLDRNDTELNVMLASDRAWIDPMMM